VNSKLKRRILVTGSSSGIGLAVAQELLGQGHQVLGIARDFSKCRLDHPAFQREIVDLADLAALPDRLGDLLKRHPHPDAAVLCAGRGRFGGLEEFAFEEIRSLIELNFTSQAYLARALLPGFKQQGSGDLVFIGSEAALQGKREGAVYCASKFALRGFAQALREECSRAGIRVTILQPGMVQSPFFDSLDFHPGEDPENALLPGDLARLVGVVLDLRREAVVDEIVLSPLKKVVRFRGAKKGR
jgi:short-subunit dehydrogenase